MENLKKQIAELVKLRYPDECLIVGDAVINDLIEDYIRGIKDAGEKYHDTNDGYNFSIYEYAILIFTGIQAMAALVDVINQMIEKHKNKVDEQKHLQETVKEALIDAGISHEAADNYCKRYLERRC